MYGETIDDAVAISEMVKTLPQVVSDQVYILGHSLGGYITPRIAQKSEVAGYIIMAGNVRSLSEMLAYQVPYLLDLDGVRTPEEEGYFNMIQGELAKLENLDSLPAGRLVFGVNKIYWMDLEHYKPLEVAEGITEPVLVLQGERDYQVTMVDFSMWQDSFGEKENWQFISYPTLNHLMVSGEGISSPEEYMIPGKVSSDLIYDIAEWIHNQN